jgi:hypothetical protein
MVACTWWANPSLGGTTRNHFKEWLKHKKTTKSIFYVFFVKCFHNYKLLFFHVYQFHVIIYGFKLILTFKKLNLKKYIFLIKLAP